ncbi:ATP-binding protein [Pseudooceanicola sp. LIPI14-2-Ac024]|uniref:sensor histidine kinase n=1 Tax=Pseudooceanicola sp. LIPI14-2-Ac024 TaxID=3344875 RepID=UPI0035CF71EF
MTALKILVVDDDAGDRMLIERLVRSSALDAETRAVATADDALAFDAFRPDAVMLDNRLPSGDGLDLIPRLKDRWPQVAIILMTGQGDEEIAKSAILHGAQDYIAKRSLSQSSVERMVRNGVEAECLIVEASAAQRELETFAHVLVHDFKAPIRAIGQLADEAMSDLSAGVPEAAHETLVRLHKAVAQASELITSLASHISADSEDPFRMIPAAHPIDRALTALRPEIDERGARISQSGTDAQLWGSPPQLAQLFQNLIGNALKYSPDGPPVIRVTAEPGPDGGLQVTVEDEGIGVPEAYRDQIFEPFKRLRTAGVAPGTGLGLATCRKIADRHGATLVCLPGRSGGTRMVCGFPPAPVQLLPRTGTDGP